MARFRWLFLLIPALAFAAEPKQKPPEQPAAAKAVLAELGVSRKINTQLEVPKDFAPDDVSAEDVRKDSKKYAFRAAVLKAGETLKPARSVAVLTEFRGDQQKWQDAIKKRQLPLAVMISDLDELIADLHKLEADRAQEKSKRWKTNYDFLLAEAMYRLVVLHEINKAYAQILVDQLPEPKRDRAEAVWNLVPVEKLQSNRDIRDQYTVAKGKLTAIVRELKARDEVAPWYFLADELLSKPVGFHWELAKAK